SMHYSSPRHARGMTLIELMVVVVIATILVSIAVPSYMSQMRQSRRIEAKTALLDLAGREERYFSTSNTGANYSANPGDLGYGTAGGWPMVVGSGYYQVTVTVCGIGANCGPGGIPGPSYFVQADPVATQSQAKDTQCGSFIVDSVGGQYIAGGSQTAQYCWNN
ncbi:MAG TPA: type IV pilin protein, partial [Steroidobacteraceae bacterium]|nr:type IV pilin protein [Steroidobacteraceae bacterium]